MEVERASKRWITKHEIDLDIVEQLKTSLGIDTIIARLLVSRGIHNFEEAKIFFRPELQHLHDPFLMRDMEKAVVRISKAIDQNEKILVYGDYDVDGTTSVALMYGFLKTLTKNVSYYIPDRYTEGYGVSSQGIQYAVTNGYSLIITLDCGIKALDKVALAFQHQIDFIICDHHLPGESVPPAHAVLNPKQTNCNYPYKELSGCGIGFKLVEALVKYLKLTIDPYATYLDLVALSIAADIVPLSGENRMLAFYGLKKLSTRPNIGLKILLGKKLNPEYSISDIVFKIAPKINAAGRIDHAKLSVELLDASNEVEAIRITHQINIHNNTRKELDAEATEEAHQLIIDSNEVNAFATVVMSKKWHKGVLGIVASRLIETYYRPTLVATESQGKLVASARSVRGYDIYEALNQCTSFLEQFGGHKYAAGLTMDPTQYEPFKNRFNEVVAQTISNDLLIPKIEIDAEIQLKEISPKFYRLLKQFAPFGPKNMRPVFLSTEVYDGGNARTIGVDDKHLKLSIFQRGSDHVFNAVGFNLGHYIHDIKQAPFDIVYTIEENFWQGKSYLQFNIKDIRLRF